MKSQFKTVAFGAIFSIIGLCFTLSTASAESSSARMKVEFSTDTYTTNFPTLVNEGRSKDKPLLKPGNGLTEFAACEVTAKNEYFELAIIFNDKLQQLISVLFVDDMNNNAQRNQITKID